MKKLVRRNCLAYEEFEPYMRAWCEKKPELVTVENFGKSSGYDVWGAVFTDKRVPDENKQVVFVTAQHTQEISGVATVLSLGNFLVSDSKDAEEILKNIIVVTIPCPNPYTYIKGQTFSNEFGIDEYSQGFTWDGARTDGKGPSSEIIQKVLDKYQPELFIDAHGVWYNHQIMGETYGCAGNTTVRPYNSQHIGKLLNASTEAGFCMDCTNVYETLDLYDPTCTQADKFRPWSSGAVAQTYAYIKYHTIEASLECAWEKHGVAVIVNALKQGMEIWPGESVPGYPVRTPYFMRALTRLRAYGATAEQRRKSRVEMWQNRDCFSIGISHPEMPGISNSIVAVSSSALERCIKADYEPMTTVVERLRGEENTNPDKILEILSDEYESFSCCDLKKGKELKLTQGMTIRLSLPFPDAEVKTVLYNGNELSPDTLDGYTIVKSRNFVHVDVNVPADKIAPFAIATVKYDCTEYHESGIVEY